MISFSYAWTLRIQRTTSDRTLAKIFFKHHYSVIRFDTTNTFGESDGEYADATTTNYYEDLEDVIHRTQAQSFYQEPFVLCGHSLGGICTTLYTEFHPEQVKALAPLATVVSGKLSKETYTTETLQDREKTGLLITPRSSGGLRKLKRNHFFDRLHYDLLPDKELMHLDQLANLVDDRVSKL